MKVELISIGDELLIGQTINTNASWIGRELSNRGFDIMYGSVVKDKEQLITAALELALERVDLVIITGGLGPTKDDITKHTLCKYFETDLELNEEVLLHVKSFFKHRKLEMLDVNIQQAFMPKSARVLKNNLGTASGMWFDKDEKVVISLPGVPYEMKNILEENTFDLLINRFSTHAFYSKTLLLQGIGESYLAERIEAIEDRIHELGLGLAYLPSPGTVRLRIYGESNDEVKSQINSFAKEIRILLPQYVFGEGEETLSEVVGRILKERNALVGTVESFTSGGLASEFVKSAGASSYFKGGIVSYTNEMKSDFVGVDKKCIENFGVVSEEVVCQMAKNGRKKLGVDYCISTSGIAGPDGGSDETPVGTVWVGLSCEAGTWGRRFQFGNERERNTKISILTALNLLRCELLKINIEKS